MTKFNNTKQLYDAIEEKLPKGWVIRNGSFSNIIVFNEKFGSLGILAIEIDNKAWGDALIRFHPHRARKFNQKNVQHFATLMADEARRLETCLDEVA